MIVGFNHNVTYRGTGFHVQTEDSGLQKPQLVTLLYHAGTIVASQKTVYADIVKVDNLDQVVEELAKEQHKGMLRRLTKGEFDERIIELGIPLAMHDGSHSPAKTAEPAAEPPPVTLAAPVESRPEAQVKIVEEPIVDKFRQAKPAQEPTTLDELIFAYLTAGQKQG